MAYAHLQSCLSADNEKSPKKDYNMDMYRLRNTSVRTGAVSRGNDVKFEFETGHEIAKWKPNCLWEQ